MTVEQLEQGRQLSREINSLKRNAEVATTITVESIVREYGFWPPMPEASEIKLKEFVDSILDNIKAQIARKKAELAEL